MSERQVRVTSLLWVPVIQAVSFLVVALSCLSLDDFSSAAQSNPDN